MTDVLKPGIYPGMTNAEYHERRLGVVSKSAIDQVHRSELHYQHWLENGSEPTAAMLFGTAFHAALLEPDVFDRDYVEAVEFGDCRNPENKARRNAWREATAGKTVVTASDAATIEAMCASVSSHPLASKLLSGGVAETSLVWEDADTGLLCKARPDYYVAERKLIVDVKTAADASLAGFRKSVGNFRYHVQDALYRMGAAGCGLDVEHFIFVVVEKTAPYAIGVYRLDDDSIASGYHSAQQDMQKLEACVRDAKFPGYPVTIQTVNVPSWAA